MSDFVDRYLTEERTVQVSRAPGNRVRLEDTAIETHEWVRRIQASRGKRARATRRRGHVGDVVQVERCSIPLPVRELEVVESRVVQTNGQIVINCPRSVCQRERDIVGREPVYQDIDLGREHILAEVVLGDARVDNRVGVYRYAYGCALP